MTITPQQLIALLPLLIVGLTVVVVMLSIAWRRNHFLNATLSVLGLNAALVSLWFVGQNGAMDVTPLIRVDGYAMLYTGLVLLASLATCTFAYPWLEGYKDNKEEFYLLVLIAALGGILLAGANHLAALFLGIELISLPLFGLVGYAFRQKRSLEASIKYTILSAAASSFLLFGMALVYANSGNLSFLALGKSLADNMLHEPLLLAGLGLMIVGLGFKLSLVPFHLWTPDVYQGAPAPVSTFLATASKIAIFGVVMRLFLYMPVFVIILFSFNKNNTNMVFDGFTLKWYLEVFQGDSLLKNFWLSIELALVSMVISVVLGTLATIGLYRYEFKLKKFINGLLYVPIVIPELVIGLASLASFSKMGMTMGFATMVFAHVTFCLPFVIITLRSRIANFDGSIEEAAMDLGANQWHTLKRVTIPMLTPGIISGALLSITLSIDDVIISYFVSGAGDITFPIKVYGMVRGKITTNVYVISTLMIVGIVVIYLLAGALGKFISKRREIRDIRKIDAQ